MSTAISTFDAGTTVFLELAFTDRNGVAATPTALTMQIIDTTNGKVVYAVTSQTPPVSPQTTLEIAIAASVNVMTVQSAYQSNTVIVSATYSDASITVAHFPYTLCNPAQVLVKGSPKPQ